MVETSCYITGGPFRVRGVSRGEDGLTALHSEVYILHFEFYILHYILHFILYSLHLILDTLRSAFYMQLRSM